MPRRPLARRPPPGTPALVPIFWTAEACRLRHPSPAATSSFASSSSAKGDEARGMISDAALASFIIIQAAIKRSKTLQDYCSRYCMLHLSCNSCEEHRVPSVLNPTPA